MAKVTYSLVNRDSRKPSMGGQFLWFLKRVTPETAFGEAAVGDFTPEQRALYDRACIYAARLAMQEWRDTLKLNPIFRSSPLDRMMIRNQLMREAVERRNRFVQERINAKA